MITLHRQSFSQLMCTTSVAAGVVLLCTAACRNPNETGAPVKTVWFQAQDGFTRSRPALDGSTVFVASGDGAVIARAVSTGQALWTKRFFDPTEIQGSELVTAADVVIAVG